MRVEDFNKIFVISLVTSQDRRSSIKKQLNQLGLDFEFFDAFNGKALSDSQLNKYNPKASIMASGREMTPAEIGCALSHITIYEKIINEGIERAVIFEDDSIINKDFLKILKNWEKIPADWELVLFCHGEDKMKLLETLGKPTIYKNYRCVSFKGAVGITSAYAINRLGAKKLLDYAYPIRFTADGLTGRFMDTGVRLYGILPHCCYQSNDFRSIIDPSRHAPGSFS